MALTNSSPTIAFVGITVACIIISQAVAYVATQDDWPGVLSSCAAASIGIHWAVFVASVLIPSEKLFDLCGSFTFCSLAVYSIAKGGTYFMRQLLVTLCVLLWAPRLGIFLFLRIQRAGYDGRFVHIKDNKARLFNMWTIQGLWVFLMALPVFCLNATQTDYGWSWNDYLGFLLFWSGFACEVIADNQKLLFRQDEANKDRWIDTGLWKLSRHPNYLGEMMLWTGIFLVSSSVLTDGQWISIISPVFVVFLLTKVSGIPLLEVRADEKWKGNQAYEEYKKKTGVLFPKMSSIIEAMGGGSPSTAGDLQENLLIAEEDKPEPAQPPIVEAGAPQA